MDRIRRMFNMQNKLNKATCGDSWMTGETDSGNTINWNRCIYMEAVEAIDSFNWKHWKDLNGEPDWKNAKVEIIDIWHFLMSEIMHKDNIDLVDNFAILAPSENPSQENIINLLEKIIILSAVSSEKRERSDLVTLSNVFFELLAEAGMDISELYANYLVKNQLNVFRQNNGYKDGTYIKHWDAVEDNIIALNIMQTNPQFTPDELYAALESEYSHIPENNPSEDNECVFSKSADKY